MDKQERNEKIELYGNGFAMLVEVLKDIPPEMWQFKPEPKEWSIHEVIIHLADSEIERRITCAHVDRRTGRHTYGL